MKVSARIVKGKNGQRGISIKKLGRDRQVHAAGTVIMSKVSFSGGVMGDLIEESEKRLMPRIASSVTFTRDGNLSIVRGIRDWGQARYIGSLGGYYNTRTGERVESAEYVYMVGDKIFYTN